MKYLVYSVTALMLGVSMTATAQSKFDVESQSIVNAYTQQQANPGKLIASPHIKGLEFKTISRAGAEVACIVDLAKGYTADDLAAAGLAVQAEFGNTLIVAGPMDDIIAAVESPAVASASLSRTYEPVLNKARISTGHDKVQAGTDLDKAYKGTGVVAGIFDTGIDPNHVNFYDMDFTGNRVQRFWKFTSTTGTYIEYTPDNLTNATSDNTSGTHGTHTLGCMAGGHNKGGLSSKYPTGCYMDMSATTGRPVKETSKKNIYYGAAPDAEIAAAGGSLTDANILMGAQKIAEYAKSVGKRAVLNLSIGMITGPKDGTSKFCRELDKLGEEMIVFVAAGNDGDSEVTAIKALTAADNSFKTALDFSQTSTGVIQIYSTNDSQCTITLGVFDKTTNTLTYQYENSAKGEKVVATSNYTATGYIHDKAFDDAFSGSYFLMNTGVTENNRWNTSISYQLQRNTTTNADYNKVPVIFVKGEAGAKLYVVNKMVSGNANLASLGQAGWSNGTSEFTISDMASGHNVICIGAYNTRKTWPILSGGSYVYSGDGMEEEDVAGYSSYGVLMDGRSLPHICAPGTGIISSLNSYAVKTDAGNSAKYTWNGRDYYWGCMQGTSMATPFAAGVVATWLEAYPSLTRDEALEVMQSTAKKDSHVTGTTQWGAGKLDAYEGLKQVIRIREAGGVSDIVIDKNDDNSLIIADKGANQFEVFFGGAAAMDVRLFNLSGGLVKTAQADGDVTVLDASALTPGIYVANVNGKVSRRIVVR